MKKGAKRRTRVALIYGGVGGEREVSKLGIKTVLSLIDKEKYIPYPVEISDTGEWFARSGSDERIPVHPVRRGGKSGFVMEDGFLPCQVAFPLLHGEWGEDGRVQGLLDCLGFKYVGCSCFAGAVAFDKACTKIIAESLGIPTVRWIATDKEETADGALRLAEENIGYPMFIKPSAQGSSIGAGLVRCREEFKQIFETAKAASDGRVLIEEYLEEKRELECAYLELPDEQLVTPPGEVIIRGFYGYGEKYLGEGAVVITPDAKVSDEVKKKTREYALLLKKALCIRHLSRFDFFLTQDRLYLNEVNTMPGFTEDSLYPLMIERAGIEKGRLISILIDAALGK